jgi:D-xylose transport system ATP-binding protein
VSGAARVEMRGVHKRFGGVRAVDGASLELWPGEVVGLLGHNGAGKSTLIKLLSGALALDAGEIRIDGAPVWIQGPRDARRRGIETLYQDLALADNLDVAANLFLGREIATRWGGLDERAMERAARDVLGRLNPEFRGFGLPVRHLSGGQRQCVAIARAIHFEARVLILDEPTASLGPQETALVAGVIRRLRSEGIGILLVSHDLHDVFDLSDRIVVMKNGRIVGGGRTPELTRERALELIIVGDTRTAD